jgi:aspartate kinase
VGVGQRNSSSAGAVSHEELERDVVARLTSMEDIVVSEVQLDRDQSRVTIRNLPDIPGTSARIFAAVAEGGVMVDLIVQNAGHSGQANLSFTVARSDLEQCLLLVREVLDRLEGLELTFDREIAKLSVSGIGLRSHTGVGDKMFRALAEAEINVQMISTSEIRISTVIALNRADEALKCLNATFGLA